MMFMIMGIMVVRCYYQRTRAIVRLITDVAKLNREGRDDATEHIIYWKNKKVAGSMTCLALSCFARRNNRTIATHEVGGVVGERPWPHSSPAEERATVAADVMCLHTAAFTTWPAAWLTARSTRQFVTFRRPVSNIVSRFHYHCASTALSAPLPGCSGRVFSPTEAPSASEARAFVAWYLRYNEYAGYYAPAVRGGVLTAVGALTTERVDGLHIVRPPNAPIADALAALRAQVAANDAAAAAAPSARTASDTQPRRLTVLLFERLAESMAMIALEVRTRRGMRARATRAPRHQCAPSKTAHVTVIPRACARLCVIRELGHDGDGEPESSWRLPPSCFRQERRLAKRLDTSRREAWSRDALAHARRAAQAGLLEELYDLAQHVFAQQLAADGPSRVAAAAAAIRVYMGSSFKRTPVPSNRSLGASQRAIRPA